MNDLTETLVETGKRLVEGGYIIATEGNLSFRTAGDTITCTAGGLSKGELKISDLITVDMNSDQPLPAHISSEIMMHLEVYRQRPDITTIIHAHPTYAISVTLSDLTLDKPYLPEAVIVLGSVPTVPYGRPSSAELPVRIRPYIKQTDVLLLERHGSLTIGKSFQAAFHKLEILEKTAKIVTLASQSGALKPLPAGEVDQLMRLRTEKFKLDYPVMRFA